MSHITNYGWVYKGPMEAMVHWSPKLVKQTSLSDPDTERCGAIGLTVLSMGGLQR